jgi:hypothetical protein
MTYYRVSSSSQWSEPVEAVSYITNMVIKTYYTLK